MVVGVCGAVLLRFMLQKANRELERLESEDVTLDEKELEKLKKTADTEGIDLATARTIQKGYRYII